jgi:hypothetical protein
VSYDALDWWHANARRYVDLPTEPELWVLADVLARHTGKDPREGAYPSQTRLAEVLGVKAETVGRYIARLEATGVIKVIPRGGPQVPGKPGRRPHLYVFPELIAAHGLPPTSPHGVGGNSGETPSGVTSDASAADRRQTGGVTSDPRGDYLRSQGRVTSDPTSLTSGLASGRGKAFEGEEGTRAHAREETPSPPRCKAHPDGPDHDQPCRACGRWRKHLEDTRELTREDVNDLIGRDDQQPPTPPDELLDNPRAAIAWQRQWKAERDAERLKRAKAVRRDLQEGEKSEEVKYLARRIIDRRRRRNEEKPWESTALPTWFRAMATARNLVNHPWCGRCDEFHRTVRNEYGGPEACQCRPGRRHGVAS